MTQGRVASSDALTTRAPRPFDWHVPRTRLVEQVLGGGPLVVVRGPAGSGKTQLAAQAARAHAASGGVAVWVDVSRTPGPEALEHALRDALDHAGADVLLVLDAYDARSDATTDRHVVDALERDERLRVVAVARRRTELEAPGAAVRVGVTLVDAASLRVDAGEVRAMAEASGVVLDEDVAARVARATGGVVAQVRWLVVAHEQGRVQLPVVGLSTLAHLAGRVAATALDGAASWLVDAWSALATPEALPPGLAEAVVGPVATAAVEAAEERGLGAFTADGTFTFTPGARHALTTVLRADPQRADRALQATMRWALDHGDYIEGLRTAVLGRDYDAAGRVVLEHWTRMASLDAARTVAIVGTVPRSELLRRPYLALTLAVCHDALPGHRARALEHLGILLASVAYRYPRAAAGERAVLLSIESVALRLLGRGVRAASVAQRALWYLGSAAAGRDDDLDPVRTVVVVQLGTSLLAGGDVVGALETVRAADVDSDDDSHAGVLRRARLAFFAAVAGRSADARAELAGLPDHRELAATFGPHRASMAALARAMLRLEEGSLDEADAVLRSLDEEMRTDELWPFHALTDALVCLGRGVPQTALTRLEHCQRRGERTPVAAPWQQAISVTEVLLLVAAGHADAARVRLRRLDPAHPGVRLATASLRLALGEDAGALAALGERPGDALGGSTVAVSRHLLLATAALRLGDEAAALRDLARAVEDVGAARTPWLLVPHADAEALAELAARSDPALHAVVAARPPFAHAMPARVESVHLSEREQVVLHGLADDVDLATLAQRLYVSVNTLKTQSRGLYRKLGARSRAEAVLAARRRGLLP